MRSLIFPATPRLSWQQAEDLGLFSLEITEFKHLQAPSHHPETCHHCGCEPCFQAGNKPSTAAGKLPSICVCHVSQQTSTQEEGNGPRAAELPGKNQQKGICGASQDIDPPHPSIHPCSPHCTSNLEIPLEEFPTCAASTENS